MIESSARRANDYTGDGTTSTFPYTFIIFAAADLSIYVSGVLQVLGTHYGVTGIGVETGGNVVFLTAPAIGTTVKIRSNLPAVQRTHFADGSKFPARTVELALDRLVALYQQGIDRLGRAPLLDPLSASHDLTLADPVAGRTLRWKTDLSGLENIDLTTLLPGSATLPLTLANGGTGATTALAARAALGLDGQVRKVLTNLTGVALVLGDVVMLDPATDNTVVLGDTVSSKAQFVVALGSIAHTATGEFLLSGIGTVRATSPVIRGRYLRKSSTTRVVEDAGVLHGAATDPPQGSFGVALTGESGGLLTARLFGFTYPGSTAPVITGLYHTKGLTGANNAGTPNTQFDVTATFVVVRNPSTSAILVLPGAAKTLDISLAGPLINARDQVAAFTANSWLHLYWIAKSDGTLDTIASLTAPPTGPTLPTGYTLWAYLGVVRLNNASALVRSRLRGAQTWYDEKQTAITDSRVTVETAVSLASFIPPTALTAILLIRFYADNTVYKFKLRLVSGVEWLDNSNASTATANSTQLTIPNIGQQFFFLWVSTPPVGLGLTADVVGYEISN